VESAEPLLVIRKASRCGRDSAAWYSLGLPKKQALSFRSHTAVESLQKGDSVPFALIFGPIFFPGLLASCPDFSPLIGQDDSIETVIASTPLTQRKLSYCPMSGSDPFVSRLLIAAP